MKKKGNAQTDRKLSGVPKTRDSESLDRAYIFLSISQEKLLHLFIATFVMFLNLSLCPLSLPFLPYFLLELMTNFCSNISNIQKALYL